MSHSHQGMALRAVAGHSLVTGAVLTAQHICPDAGEVDEEEPQVNPVTGQVGRPSGSAGEVQDQRLR